jgi:hypothetical protein
VARALEHKARCRRRVPPECPVVMLRAITLCSKHRPPSGEFVLDNVSNLAGGEMRLVHTGGGALGCLQLSASCATEATQGAALPLELSRFSAEKARPSEPARPAATLKGSASRHRHRHRHGWQQRERRLASRSVRCPVRPTPGGCGHRPGRERGGPAIPPRRCGGRTRLLPLLGESRLCSALPCDAWCVMTRPPVRVDPRTCRYPSASSSSSGIS